MGRLDEPGLDGVREGGFERVAPAGIAADLAPSRFAASTRRLGIVEGEEVDTGLVEDEPGHRAALPRRRQVDRRAAIGDFRSAARAIAAAAISCSVRAMMSV